MSINRTRLLEDTAALVRINSVNPALVEGGAGEGEVADTVARWMEELGLTVERIPSDPPGRPSVVGTLPGTGGGRSLMLNAHTDTVGVEGMDAPFTPRRDGPRLYGRGSQDMKGSLAAQLAAVRALQATGTRLKGDLIVAAVADEEHGSLGTEAVLRHVRPDGAVVTEPTDLHLCLAHKGFVWLDVTVHGRAAHGSRPSEGIDANVRAARVVQRVAALGRTLQARDGHPLTGPPSVHVPLVRGGSASSVYAAECTLRIERRLIPGETVDEARDEIAGILEALQSEDDTFRADLDVPFHRGPLETPADSAMAAAVRAAATEVRDAAPEEAGQTYWTDAGLLAAAGVDTVVYGPEGAGLHTTEEWVDVHSLVDLAAVLARTAGAYCGTE